MVKTTAQQVKNLNKLAERLESKNQLLVGKGDMSTFSRLEELFLEILNKGLPEDEQFSDLGISISVKNHMAQSVSFYNSLGIGEPSGVTIVS